jgi:cobalt/nickel transport system ATP-binding protein
MILEAGIIQANDVSFAYGPGAPAIHGMNFALAEPRRVCLLGANGVGKSTLMMLLNGTLRPREGELAILGSPIDYSRAGLHALRREVGVVLQDPDDQLFAATVEQDVAFGLLNNGVDSAAARRIVTETLARLGISHLADRPVHELSLGEKKRAALAGILVLRPKIILLDEPTAGLDYAGISAMLALLNDLCAAGTTLIVSTHDSDLAYEWADEAWIMNDGHIAAQGPVGDVFRLVEVLARAHLRVPALVEIGLAMQDAYPELADAPLPRSREGLAALIKQTGTNKGEPQWQTNP